MNRLKMALVVLLLACARFASAGSDPVTIETRWNQKTVQFTTTSVLTATFDVGGFGAQGYAINGGTIAYNGVDGTTYGSTGTIVLTSTTTVFIPQNVVGADYWFTATGSTGNFKLAQTIKTPPPLGVGFRQYGNATSTATLYSPGYAPSNFFVAPVISTSSTIIFPTGTQSPQVFRGKVTNPVFILGGLMPSATYTLTVDYLVPALQ